MGGIDQRLKFRPAGGRVPLRYQNAGTGDLLGVLERKIAEGLLTPRRPRSVIVSNTPSSLTARIDLTNARISLNVRMCVALEIPEQLSTICSRTWDRQAHHLW